MIKIENLKNPRYQNPQKIEGNQKSGANLVYNFKHTQILVAELQQPAKNWKPRNQNENFTEEDTKVNETVRDVIDLFSLSLKF